MEGLGYKEININGDIQSVQGYKQPQLVLNHIAIKLLGRLAQIALAPNCVYSSQPVVL
jgi:hypothetical protein